MEKEKMTRAWRERSPREWQRLVNQEVRVTALGQPQCEGHVFTVDPVSASLVLLLAGPRRVVRVVLGHAVREVELLRAGGEDTERRMRSVFLRDPDAALRPEESACERRRRLRLWLENNRFPVREEGETLRVAGVLTISAPYRPGDCCCANQIILGRVRRLLERLGGGDT